MRNTAGMAARSYLPPAGFVSPGGTWPSGPFVDETALYALVTARLVERLQRVMAERGLTHAHTDIAFLSKVMVFDKH